MADTDKSDAPRSNSVPWIVLSGVLGLFAVGTPVAPKAAQKDAPAPAKADQPDDTPNRTQPIDSLLKPIQEFHSARDGHWTPDDLGRAVHGYRTEFLIATVPDPIDSPFGFAFDQTVDAIQRAVQQKDGYVLDRAWLPWEVDRKAKPAPGTEPANLRETMPGVLLFRHGKDAAKGVEKPGLCVVFLVGETPMGGIHKRAFWKSLALIADSGLQPLDPVRVVGPYFTGSQTSLQFLLDDWLRAVDLTSWLGIPKPNHFKVVVGNASGMRIKEFFGGTWGPEKVEVAATTAPARVQLNAVLHFLAERDGARAADRIPAKEVKKLPGRVAILTESNTGFGKQFASYGDNADEVVVLRFPMHVARLKTEYAQLFRKKDEQAGLQPAGGVSAAGFEEAGGAFEGVPSQGGAATSAANNAVLANILSTISRERFRYVGILATDTRDKLFLTRLVREFCPDVHVFVTQGDLLLAHPDYLYHMKGVVVGSTYPLYPPSQRWAKPDAPERLLVPSAAAQGYYNATLAVLGRPDQMLEYGPPGFAGPGVPADRPPVWVSMVSPNGTFVPLQFFGGYEDPSGYVWRKPDAVLPPVAALEYSGSATAAGLVLAAFWLVLLVKCWRGRGVFAVTPGDSPVSHAAVFRTVLLGAQAVFAVAVIAVAGARAEHTGFASAQDFAVLGAAAVAWALLVVTALRGVSFRRIHAAGPDARRWRWDAVNLAVVVGLVAFAWVFLDRFWATGDRPHRALFFARAVDLASGLSPLTPLFLMCMAVTAGAYFQLERRELAHRCRVPSPFPADAGRVFDPLTDQDRRLKVEMTPGRFWHRYSLALSALFVALAAAGVTVWRDSLPTVEGNVWDAAFAVGFAGVYAFAALTILQTILLWRQTKQLLATLGQLPLMRVFARLPGRVASVVTKHLYTRSTQPLMLKMTVHQLRLLADTARDDPDAPAGLRNLGRLADEAEARLQEYANPAHGKAGDPAAEAALRGVLSDAAAQGLEALSPRWKGLPTDEAFGGAAAATPAAPAPEPAWVPRAEELVATQLVNYLAQFFIQLRSLMLAVLVCSSLLLIAATSYPFHPEKLLLVFLLGLVGAGLAAVVYVFVDMTRDEAVSRAARTSGRFSLDGGMLGAFFTYIVPTVGLLAAQLSGTFRWALEPILRVVK